MNHLLSNGFTGTNKILTLLHYKKYVITKYLAYKNSIGLKAVCQCSWFQCPPEVGQQAGSADT